MAPSKIHYMCPQHEAEEFQSTGCMFHTDGLNQNVSNIIPMYIYIYTSTSTSIYPSLPSSIYHSTTPQATNIFNPFALTMQPSNSRSPLLTELLEDTRLRGRPFRSCLVLETGQSWVMWPTICCFVGDEFTCYLLTPSSKHELNRYDTSMYIYV